MQSKTKLKLCSSNLNDIDFVTEGAGPDNLQGLRGQEFLRSREAKDADAKSEFEGLRFEPQAGFRFHDHNEVGSCRQHGLLLASIQI